MWSPKLFLVSLCISALSTCTAAGGGKPLVSAVTKDASTSLYTAPLKDGRPLVLDLSGPVITLTTCSSKNGTVTTLSANATDGANPLFPVSFPAAASCGAPPKLPAAAVGVAGLGPSSQSFLAQVARTQKVANKLALCLPSDGKTTSGNSVGVAIFGGGPLIFPDRGDFTTMLAGTAPLRGFSGSPGYYVSANTACLGFVRAAGQAPAAVLGGFQMENRLLVLDVEKKQLGFTTFLNGVGLSCSNFNFTLAA
ncbi:hypothetical protein PVAP13_4KG256000 [Panicum virgatum]|uniref:Peptidase A1 domain-containing protein n=1 Tax=Panicum virgatum TaxID=38727 RepID=A0A8T0TMB0_PANVG|nr:hypothetical protein PVAP13_4KG256000 [Panicum virgatum]